MAGIHYFNPEKREIQKEQIYILQFEEMSQLIEKYFINIPLLDIDKEKVGSKKYVKYKLECSQEYINACNHYYQSDPPEFLKSPFCYEYVDGWGLNERYGFEFIVAYMLNTDYQRIVINENKDDDMSRGESRQDLFLKWKHIFSAYELTKNLVYKL